MKRAGHPTQKVSTAGHAFALYESPESLTRTLRRHVKKPARPGSGSPSGSPSRMPYVGLGKAGR